VPELVGEDAHAAVLGLDRVVADPDAGVAELVAAHLAAGRALVVVRVGVGAVAPDRVGAAVGVLALARVDHAEVVDVAVRLVEVAVVVAVVAVGLVDLGDVDAAVVAGRDEAVERGLHDARDRAVGVVAAVAALLAVGAEVGLGAVDRRPVGHLAVPGEAARRELLVEVGQRRVAVGAAARREQHVLVVLDAEVRRPVGAVVLRAVRLRHGVVLEVREVDQRDRHLLGGLEPVLDVAAVVELHDALRVRRLLAAGHEVRGRLLLALPLLDEAGQVLHVAALGPLRPWRGLRHGAGDARERHRARERDREMLAHRSPPSHRVCLPPALPPARWRGTVSAQNESSLIRSAR